MQQNTNYPILNRLGFTDRDVARLNALPSNSTAIDRYSIKNFVLGTSLDTINSNHINSPIFNLANLDEEGLLDLNPNSSSQDDMSIILTSNKDALSNSYAWSLDVNLSASFMGQFGASVNGHYENSLAYSNSDGKIMLTMTREKTGSYYEILALGMSGEGVNLTPFLKGAVMDDVDPENAKYRIKDYVDFTEKPVAENDDRTYIDTLIIKGHNNTGQIDWSLRRYYENIRLLTEMETVFASLLHQYKTYSDLPLIQDVLYRNMLQLKETIGHAIKDFYTLVGDHFVSKLLFRNFIYGYGELNFKERTTNHELAAGTGVSIGGGIPSQTNGTGGGSASYAMKNGWANYSKNIEIHVQAQPSNIGETKEFATAIKKMLDEESPTLNVPNLDMASTAKVSIKEPKETKKPSTSPPDSVFKSYAQWKDYQADLKKKSKIDSVQRDAEKKVKENPGDTYIEIEKLAAMTDDSHDLYDGFMDELQSLGCAPENVDGAAGTTSGESQVLRLDDMFVSGFAATPYEAVIPALRASGIELPDQSNRMNAYPNATALMVHMDIITKLVEYVNFISQFSISNINFQNRLDKFLNTYTKNAQALIASHMGSGIDIHASLVNNFFKNMYRDDKVQRTALFKALEDRDQVAYFKYILGKDVYRCWYDAPGGYAPFIFDDQENLCFAELDSLFYGYPDYDGLGRMVFKQNRKVTEPPDDIAALYDGLNQSPLFPIFRYEGKETPKLLYNQFAGPYQFIYGKNAVMYAHEITEKWKWRRLYLNHTSFNDDTVGPISSELINQFVESTVGWDVGNVSWALYFPRKTQTQALRRKFRIRLLNYAPCHEVKPFLNLTHSKGIVTSDGHNKSYSLFFQDNYSFMNQELCKNKGKITKVSNGNLRQTKGLRVLLPIGYDKIQRGYGSLIMGSAYGFEDIVKSKSFETAGTSSLYS